MKKSCADRLEKLISGSRIKGVPPEQREFNNLERAAVFVRSLKKVRAKSGRGQKFRMHEPSPLEGGRADRLKRIEKHFCRTRVPDSERQAMWIFPDIVALHHSSFGATQSDRRALVKADKVSRGK